MSFRALRWVVNDDDPPTLEALLVRLGNDAAGAPAGGESSRRTATPFMERARKGTQTN